MREWVAAIPPIDLMLGGGLAVIAVIAIALRTRGGRFRGLARRVLVWVVFPRLPLPLRR